jgi:NAD+ synthase
VSPIGELYKSEVRALGRHMWVQPALTEAVPTDGLHTDGATDEDQIGATYDELEWAMKQHGEFMDIRSSNFSWTDRRASVDWAKDQFSDRARQVMEIYIARHYQNAHKMSMPPVFAIPE